MESTARLFQSFFNTLENYFGIYNYLEPTIIFSFLFCSFFIHVQNCFSMTQLYAIFFAQGHPCGRCGSPECKIPSANFPSSSLKSLPLVH